MRLKLRVAEYRQVGITLFVFHFAYSVGVVGDVGGRGVTGATGVLTLGGGTVGSCSLEKGGLGSGDVLALSEPCLEDGLLEGAAVREGEGPGTGNIFELVHGVEVD